MPFGRPPKTGSNTLEEAEEILALQRRSAACGMCPQYLQSAEDAAVVDLGGEARLAHRFCQRNRGGLSMSHAIITGDASDQNPGRYATAS